MKPVVALLALVISLIAAAGGPVAQEAQKPAYGWTSEWPDTDFGRASVPFAEIFSGGPPKDGIPAIDNPKFIAVADEASIGPKEPVVALELDGETPRAYPVRYLIWHEIVNDRIGARPVTITFCPLCNSAIVFDGRHNGRELTFGVSGKLRFSDMVMYDRQTQSWWQQFLGRGIVGEMTGEELTTIPSWMEDWESFRARNPDGLVMAQPTRWRRAYGKNPYGGYDGSEWPFLYRGDPPPHGVPPLARVVAVGKRAWPLSRLAEEGEIVEAGVRLTWRAGQASALGAEDIASARDVGNVRSYDAATGALIAHDIPFAFAFHAFTPDGEWMMGGG